MQSNNPVFRRSEEFNSAGSNAYGNQTYAGNGRRSRATARPATPTRPRGAPARPASPAPAAPVATGGPMTIDSVVQKTAISLFLVMAAAAVTWCMTPRDQRQPRRTPTSAR